MSSLRSQIVKLMPEEEDWEVPPTQKMIQAKKAKVINNWSRVISRLVLLIITVTKETVLDGWLQARGNAHRSQCMVEAPKDGRKGHHGSTEKGRVHTLVGHQLPASQGNFPVDRSLCKHSRDQLVARGNKTYAH